MTRQAAISAKTKPGQRRALRSGAITRRRCCVRRRLVTRADRRQDFARGGRCVRNGPADIVADHFLRRHHPAIAEPADRADSCLGLRIVAEQPARVRDQLADLHVGAIDAPPDRGDKFVAANGTRTLLHNR